MIAGIGLALALGRIVWRWITHPSPPAAGNGEAQQSRASQAWPYYTPMMRATVVVVALGCVGSIWNALTGDTREALLSLTSVGLVALGAIFVLRAMK
jgi:cytochrome b561